MSTRGCEIPPEVVKMRKEWALSDAKRDEGLIEPSDVIKYKNISYGPFGENNLLDIYIPCNTQSCSENIATYKTKILPVLINVHGGGYIYGDKELYRFVAMDMSRYGFAVINMNYRLSPENQFPAALEDINEVVRFVEKHSDEYELDADRVFMMGDSAGAQLASHYAAINSNPEFASYYSFGKTEIKIKGLALACGMYDIKKSMLRSSTKALFENYLGYYFNSGLSMLDVYSAITKDFPPTFLFSCPNDFLLEECKPMADLINSVGAKANMKIYGTSEMEEVAHVFHCNMNLELGSLARKDQAEFLLSL